ncbi:unnamed protein product [Oikopleura dioica]|uniref:Uncharacterized protein n=1 Tax=Oikopleura dioica TaxID=34765 RepID=E4XUT6_OIKDI|nr:unnamed protein product [Oikopleura dioica]
MPSIPPNPYVSEKEKQNLEMQLEASKKDAAPPAYPDPVVVQPAVATGAVVQSPVVLPGVVLAQPTGAWKRPWNSLSWCDSEVCLACWALTCYHGRIYAKIDGETSLFWCRMHTNVLPILVL